MIKLVRVTLSRPCERPEGRGGITVDSSMFSSAPEAGGYEIFEDRESRRVIVAKNNKFIAIPFESVVRCEYYNAIDAGFVTDLKVEKGEVPGEMTITLDQKRGPGRPRKYEDA